MTIAILGLYGFLIGLLMRDCKRRFGGEVFWIFTGFLIVLTTMAVVKYWEFL